MWYYGKCAKQEAILAELASPLRPYFTFYYYFEVGVHHRIIIYRRRR